MKTWTWRVAAVGLAVLLAVHSVPSRAQAGGLAPRRSGWCVSADLPVSPAWTVAATYCRPWHARRGVALDVLTHGATYDGTYWDWDQPGYRSLSYVDKALRAGRATLVYDRIGNGDSTRPASSTEITMASDAWVLHRLICLARLLGHRTVNSVSHSYGSGVALAEAATYGDVDAVVVSGYLHRPSNPAVTAGNYPANQDPKFALLGLDSGWLTSRPGVRGSSFHAPTSDPAVIAYDEAHKDVVSLTGLLGFLSARGVAPADNISRLVAVPVLVVNGQLDAIFCYQPAVFDCADQAVVAANEALFYRDVEVRTVPLAGHDLTLHPADSFSIVDAWLHRVA